MEFKFNKLNSDFYIQSDIKTKNILDYVKSVDPNSHHYLKEHLPRLKDSVQWVLDNCKKTDSIVDIGSFPWFMPAYLNSHGFSKCSTIDILRPDIFPKCQDWKFVSFTLDIEETKLPFENNSIDVVLMLEVFEHLYRRPNFVFREICRILKPEGRLVISTPNGARLGAILKAIFRLQFGNPIYKTSLTYEQLGHFDHIREYSIPEIKDYFKHFNFSVQKIRYLPFFYEEQEISMLKKIFYSMESLLPFLRPSLFIAFRNDKGYSESTADPS